MPLAGVQAVNLWALYYPEVTADLAPFASRDIDVIGQRKTLEEIAHLVGAKATYFPLRPPTNEVGVVQAAAGTDCPLVIEVLRGVRGVTNAELLDDAVTFETAGSTTRVRVPSPLGTLIPC